MGLPSLTFDQKKGGLARRPAGTDHISAMLFEKAAPTEFLTDWYKKINSVADAENNGISKTGTFADVWSQVNYYFAMSPGADLYLVFRTGTAASFQQMITDSNNQLAEVNQWGLHIIDIASVLTTKFYNNLAKVQTEKNACIIPFHLVVGCKVAPGAGSASAATNLRTLNSQDVSLVAFWEPAYAAVADATGMGAVLGAISSVKVHESIGWIERVNLQLAGFKTLATNFSLSDQGVINDKGYIWPRLHTGVDGIGLNSSHSCISATNDLAYLETNRVLNKAKRGITSVLAPKINAPVYLDATTGLIAPSDINYFEILTGQPLSDMLTAGEISGYDVYINPAQLILSTGVLNVEVTIVPVGVARDIKVVLQFALKVA
jgi:hypothetical protein